MTVLNYPGGEWSALLVEPNRQPAIAMQMVTKWPGGVVNLGTQEG
jgi:hypothetical protein